MTARLEQFKERHSKNGTPANVEIYDLSYILTQAARDGEVNRLKASVQMLKVNDGELKGQLERSKEREGISERRYSVAQRTAEDLREQLSTSTSELDNARQYASGLEKEVTSLKGDVLQGDEQQYSPGQADFISHLFYQISGEIENRKIYEKIEGEKETIRQRDQYLAEHGPEAVESLPIQEARELTQKKWQDAESLVAEYESVAPLNFPIKIAKTNEGTTVVVPVNPKSSNEVVMALYDNLTAYGAKLDSESGLEASVDNEQPFATLKITGEVDNKTIEDRLLSAFGEIAQQAKLNLLPLSVSYVTSAVEKESPAPEEVSAAPETVNPADYIRSRIRELYGTQKEFSDKNPDVKGVNNVLHQLSQGKGLRKRTIGNLATALKIDSSYLEAVIRGEVVGTSEGLSPAFETSTPVTEEVALTSEGLSPADYLVSKVILQYGTQKEFQDQTGIRIGGHLNRIRNGHELTDKTIQNIAKHFPGLRKDTLKRNLRQKKTST